MISGDDIEAMREHDEPKTHGRITKIDVGIAQYLMRQAYEEGFRSAGGGRGVSKINPNKGAWFDGWVVSQTRAMLVANGIIDQEVTYK